MDNNNGAERLISSILEDARALASAYEAQADADVATIRAELDEDREKLRDEYSRKARAERAEIIRRAKTNAELDCRKELLEKKRAVIDEAYREAAARLDSLVGSEREGVLSRLIKRECEGGETVCPAENDRETLKKLVASSGIAGLVVGENARNISGGFILKGANYVKDCSFAALMEDIRESTLEKIAGILFE